VLILNTLAPVFLLVALGAVLQRTGFVSVNFLREANRVTYWLGLPALLFSQLAGSFHEAAGAKPMLGAMVVATLLSIVTAYLAGWAMRVPAAAVGTFVQGAFRGNLAFVGLPIIFTLPDAPLGGDGVGLAQLGAAASDAASSDRFSIGFWASPQGSLRADWVDQRARYDAASGVTARVLAAWGGAAGTLTLRFAGYTVVVSPAAINITNPMAGAPFGTPIFAPASGPGFNNQYLTFVASSDGAAVFFGDALMAKTPTLAYPDMAGLNAFTPMSIAFTQPLAIYDLQFYSSELPTVDILRMAAGQSCEPTD
jgi:hypothetical protein